MRPARCRTRPLANVLRRSVECAALTPPEHSRKPLLNPLKVLEPVRGHLGVANRVLDVAMAEVVLQCAGVLADVGEFAAAGVAQHGRMNGEGQAGGIARARHDHAQMLDVIGPPRS
jgi:hypothetical protein